MVRQLSLFYSRAEDILDAIRHQQPQLIEGLRAPYEVVLQDLHRVRDEYAEELKARSAPVVIGDYVASKSQLRRMALAQLDQLHDTAKLRGIQVVSELTDDIARALGMPTDRPALALDIAELSMEMDSGHAGLSTGLVDAPTFATDERFCNMNLDKFPMQRTILEEFMVPLSPYRSLILVCGMRSGKGVGCSLLAWYAAYELLSLENPQKYFGLAPDQEIQIINLAASQSQAKNGLFKHMLDRLQTGGPWFASIRDQAKVTGLEIRLPKNIVIRCGHSKASTLVGATSYMVLMDELARFRDTEGKDNADYVYEQMSATTATFGDSGRVIVLSSPECEGDKAMRLLDEALEVDDDDHPVRPHMMGLQLATWEANLRHSQDRLWRRFDGNANPRAFWRDFGARPPTTVEGYYPDPSRWDRQADPDRRHPYDERLQLADWFKPCCDSKRFVHIDLGATRDACGIAMAHKPVPGCPYFGDPASNPRARRIVVDICLQLVPARQHEMQGEISFDRVRQFIYDWNDRGFNIKGGQVSYDGWQSLDSQQQLRRNGFRTAEFSLDRDTEGHDTLQELVNTDSLSFYRYEPLIREGKQLTLVRGRRVDHPKGGSKDVIDALAGACYFALKKGGRVSFVG